MDINSIKTKEFSVEKRGYNPDEVSSYLNEICGYIKTLEAEKINMMKKLEVLARKVEEYKKDEESIQDALLGAQKLGKSVVAEANEKAEKITKEAQENAENTLTAARLDSEKIVTDAKTYSQDLLSKSKAEAERMINEAKASIENTMRTTRYEIEKEQSNLLRMQKEVSRFKKDLLDIYRNHIDLIKKLPDEEADKAIEEKEVRELKNNIYQQKTEEAKTIEVAENVTVSAQTIEVSQADAQNAESDQVQETKEFAAEEQAQAPAEEPKEDSYVSKFGELKFGGNTKQE